MWHVYGITNPISQMIVYVGCTSQPLEKRLAQHGADRNSAAYEIIQFIRSHGYEPSIITIDYFSDSAEALIFEQQMILAIKGLCNRQHKAIRDRKLAAYMLETHEIDGIVSGNPVTPIYRRFTDYDNVPSAYIGLPMSPENLASVGWAEE